MEVKKQNFERKTKILFICYFKLVESNCVIFEINERFKKAFYNAKTFIIKVGTYVIKNKRDGVCKIV